MDKFDLTKIDLFSLEGLKRGELANIHSLLLFLYSRLHSKQNKVSFKYSEIVWMNYNTASRTLFKLEELGILDIVQKPQRCYLAIVSLKPNHELNAILNKDKIIEFEKYEDKSFTKDNLKEVLGSSSLCEHFQNEKANDWVRNVNSGSWQLNRLLTIAKLVSYYTNDVNAKTNTVCKYATPKGMLFYKSVKLLYERIPNGKKDTVYNEFENTLKNRNLKHDKSFCGMVKVYLDDIKKERALPCAPQ